MSTPAADYDSPWKEALEEYPAPFFALLFPHIHAEIDWSRPVAFLDSELQQAVRDAEIGRRLADKLLQVWRRDGGDAWVLVHVEVQAQEEPRFPRRMYVYNYRIYDHHDRQVVSLAVLADEAEEWRPSVYEAGLWGCTTRFEYPVVKLREWRARRAELEASDNPFATFILAYLAAQETRGDMAGRRVAKLALIRRLYERGYGRERVLSLFRFIDWLLALPVELEREVRRAVREIEEERKMPYVTSIERLVREEGLAQGRQEGRQEGLAEGLLEGKRAALRRLVARRFGALPAALEGRIAAMDEAALDALFDRALVATSVDDL